MKKLNSPLWRINHLYKIKDKHGNIVTFKLNEFQKDYIRKRGTHRRNIIIKYRQGGMTTFRCIEMLDGAIWHAGEAKAILAHERDAVTKIFEIVKRAFDNMPDGLKPKTKYDSKNELVFLENCFGQPLDSKIYVSTKLRSGTITELHTSERAYFKDVKEYLSGSKQALPKDGKLTEETTGNGKNEFYDYVMDAYRSWDKDDSIPQKYKPLVHFFPWFSDSTYSFDDVESIDNLTDIEERGIKKHGWTDGQIAWRRWKVSELGASNSTDNIGMTPTQIFDQEYPSTLEDAFQTTGNTFFDQEKVSAIEVSKYTTNYIKGLKIYVEPKEKARYVVGVDPSKGKGIDNACIDVWDIDQLEQVAQYYDSFTKPDDLADIAKAIGLYYNKAFVAVENNLLTCVLRLNKIYENVYKYVRINKTNDEKTEEIGFPMNLKTRPVIINNFDNLFNNDLIKINSGITKSEMQTFVQKENGKIEHADGKHDDALFGAYIALFVVQFLPKEISMSWV